MTYRYTNRATAQLAQSITPRDTIITLIPGTGDAFPALQQPTDRFALTLTSVSNPDQFEVCIVIGRQGDRVTVIRGQDNTTAQSFSSGDVASLNMTAGVYALFPQAGYMGVFDPTIANTINGYQKNAIVCDPDTPGLLWVSTKDGNKSSPSDQDGAWIHLTAGGNYADAGALDTEKKDRQNSEAALQNNFEDGINNEASLRAQADKQLQSEIDNEAALRKQADNQLQNEINDLERNKVSRSGDTMTGALFSTGLYDANGGKSTFPLGAQLDNAQIYLELSKTSDGTIPASIVFRDASGGIHHFINVTSTGNLVSQRGNPFLEVPSQGGQPMRLEAFTTIADNGSKVTFPTPFSGPPIAILMNAQENDWDCAAALGTWTAEGFTVTDYAQNDASRPQRVIIMAVGPA
ncbi:hypothetical protein GS501_04505 [Saccharibacter sp. 17.LH.SD]|uniref:hypothetical protein n=1 Tax=Saccharibacter sp. 17.LH.SD TaxID=2689393 RepID=UPI00136A070D|nr:hypothetical protein [Saccharibacter sp. 17.LH.SD]MXV44306.1 hypothetical protein [Saccharibacter sp. 17.LH.SD]